MTYLRSLQRACSMAVGIALVTVAHLPMLCHADGGFYYYGVSHSRSVTVELHCLASQSRGEQGSVVINSDRWSLPLPGITIAETCHYHEEEACVIVTAQGKGASVSLLHSLYGRPESLRLGYLSGGGFLSVRTDTRICPRFGSPSAKGAASNGADVAVTFSVGRVQTARVIGVVAYSSVLRGEQQFTKFDIGLFNFAIWDVTDPNNPVLVYIKSFSFTEPGGINHFDDSLTLYPGRIYVLDFTTNSGGSVNATSQIGPNARSASAYASGVLGSSARLYITFNPQPFLPEVIQSDVNGDGCIDDADLLAVLSCLGSTIVDTDNDVILKTECAPSDVNLDGVVDDADLLIVMQNLGMCY